MAVEEPIALITLTITLMITLITLTEEWVCGDGDAHDHTELVPVWFRVALLESGADAFVS